MYFKCAVQRCVVPPRGAGSGCRSPLDGSAPSKDRVTKYVYNAGGLMIEQIALDPNGDGTITDKQTTRYVYAMELTDQTYHPVKDGGRLRAVIYPDSDDTVTSGW